jgi:hypothetical protein
MNEYDEKRDFHRMGIDCPAQFRIQGADEVSDAIVKNLSASGMLLRTTIEIDPGTPLLVHIVPMNSITPPLSATVSVLRSEPVAEGYEVACTIEQILGDEKASAELP